MRGLDQRKFLWMAAAWLAMAIAVQVAVVFAQDAKAVISQVEYQQAESAEIVPQDGSVMIITKGLQPGIKQGAFVSVESAEEVKYAWLFADSRPPSVIRPYRPNTFFVTGQPGQKFYLGLGLEIPEVIEVVIGQPSSGPDTPPEEPPVTPPVGYEKLRKVVSDSAAQTGDVITANDLAEAYSKAAASMQDSMTVDQCRQLAARARANILGRGTFKGNWNAVLMAADAEITLIGPKTAKEYRAVIQAVSEGLKDAVQKMAGLAPRENQQHAGPNIRPLLGLPPQPASRTLVQQIQFQTAG